MPLTFNSQGEVLGRLVVLFCGVIFGTWWFSGVLGGLVGGIREEPFEWDAFEWDAFVFRLCSKALV